MANLFTNSPLFLWSFLYGPHRKTPRPLWDTWFRPPGHRTRKCFEIHISICGTALLVLKQNTLLRSIEGTKPIKAQAVKTLVPKVLRCIPSMLRETISTFGGQEEGSEQLDFKVQQSDQSNKRCTPAWTLAERFETKFEEFLFFSTGVSYNCWEGVERSRCRFKHWDICLHPQWLPVQQRKLLLFPKSKPPSPPYNVEWMRSALWANRLDIRKEGVSLFDEWPSVSMTSNQGTDDY